LFLRLWVSRLLSKPRRLPAVRFLLFNTLRHRPYCHRRHYLFVCGSLCSRNPRICWVLGAFDLHSNGRCVGELDLDTASYWLCLRALRTSSFLCHTRYYMITNGRRSQKWTFRVWLHISCRKSMVFQILVLASCLVRRFEMIRVIPLKIIPIAHMDIENKTNHESVIILGPHKFIMIHIYMH
jgi:hypothetical protein